MAHMPDQYNQNCSEMYQILTQKQNHQIMQYTQPLFYAFFCNVPCQFTQLLNLNSSYVQLNALRLTELLDAAGTVRISQHRTKLGGYPLSAIYISHNALAIYCRPRSVLHLLNCVFLPTNAMTHNIQEQNKWHNNEQEQQ